MTAGLNGASRYCIVLRGDCQALLASVTCPAEVETCPCGHTRAVVPVTDEAEFWGLLDRIQDFALHIVGLSELTDDPTRCGCQRVSGARGLGAHYGAGPMPPGAS
jgi:hypothetical protein